MLLCESGHLGLLATNTIAQKVPQKVGLDKLCEQRLFDYAGTTNDALAGGGDSRSGYSLGQEGCMEWSMCA